MKLLSCALSLSCLTIMAADLPNNSLVPQEEPMAQAALPENKEVQTDQEQVSPEAQEVSLPQLGDPMLAQEQAAQASPLTTPPTPAATQAQKPATPPAQAKKEDKPGIIAECPLSADDSDEDDEFDDMEDDQDEDEAGDEGDEEDYD